MYELLGCLIEICDRACPEPKNTTYDRVARYSDQIPVVIAQPIMVREDDNVNKKYR